MLRLGSTYIIVRDMERSVEFYSLLFNMEPSARELERWAQFDLDGGCFGIYNQLFDYKAIAVGQATDKMFNKAYVDWLGRRNTYFGNNVVHHFRVENLNDEYERLSDLNIGVMSDIFYINISLPYYYFTLTDPDGNAIEITGEYTPPAVEISEDAPVSASSAVIAEEITESPPPWEEEGSPPQTISGIKAGRTEPAVTKKETTEPEPQPEPEPVPEPEP
ncbi:MAG: VOC family protein, partial [Oscillospiraceae bacterium]|nr:VOC family protein [Oscillospiraceae bacterium]